MAVLSIRLCANQIVVATAINLISVGITGYCLKMFITNIGNGTVITVPSFRAVSIPVLSSLPFLGEVLFSYKPLTYVTILLAVLIHIYLYKTKLGLVHRSIGENPLVADTLGINVNLVRYGAVVACGVLCGISGAFMSLSNLNQFQNGMVSGRGFIAFAAVIFGGWSPFGVLGASVFFGLADAIQMRMQAMQTGISYHLLQCVPYLCTLVALVFARKSAACPASDGLPYRKEET